MTSLKNELKTVKQNLEKNEAERTKISYAALIIRVIGSFLCRKLEGEVNEKLQNIHNQLLQASAEQRESERDRNFKENLSNLQRIFPG